MDMPDRKLRERLLVKTKIVATVGPACGRPDQLKNLVLAGVDVFRLNFAHGKHAWLADVVKAVRQISQELERPVGILGDLSGPKIRLGELPPEGLCCMPNGRFEFVREPDPRDPLKLTSTYERLVDDLQTGDRVLLADGTVSMRVVEKFPQEGRVVCVVEQAGCIRTRQGINLPGAKLSAPSLTEKDYEDLAWALENELDFLGLSFVRSADDIRLLKRAIAELKPRCVPQIVAKIEKMEAVDDLPRILEETDAVMVARGDLGVEVDIYRVPLLQKKIIRMCNEYRIPVITATQMLDSMQTNELPTRAEASDVANAVLDGTDAVMLSGETAVGAHPAATVRMMDRIAREAERYLEARPVSDSRGLQRQRAGEVTEAVTLAAGTAAAELDADLIVVATHSGRTALAVSKQRNRVPILALTDDVFTSRRLSLYWGVMPAFTKTVKSPLEETTRFIIEWGRRHGLLNPGSRFVSVGSTDWSQEGKDQILVKVVS